MSLFLLSAMNVKTVVSHYSFYLRRSHCSCVYCDCECHSSRIPSELQHIRIHINHYKLISVKRDIETQEKR